MEFTEEEKLIIMEFALTAMNNREILDSISFEMDINDETVWGIRNKLCDFLNSAN